MVLGDKHLRPGIPASEDGWRARALAAALLLTCAAGVTALVSLGG
jgi:hypothetical protein